MGTELSPGGEATGR